MNMNYAIRMAYKDADGCADITRGGEGGETSFGVDVGLTVLAIGLPRTLSVIAQAVDTVAELSPSGGFDSEADVLEIEFIEAGRKLLHFWDKHDRDNGIE